MTSEPSCAFCLAPLPAAHDHLHLDASTVACHCVDCGEPTLEQRVRALSRPDWRAALEKLESRVVN